MNIELVWAQDNNGGIGKNGKLPWHVSEDLKNFKKITSGSPIVMGRKTWESLPFKPLPNRRNIVLSSKLIKEIDTYHSIESCIQILEKELVEKIFVIGGRTIYESFYYKATTLHLTVINEDVDNIDTFFPIPLNKIKENFIEVEKMNLSNTAIYTKWEKIKKSPL